MDTDGPEQRVPLRFQYLAASLAGPLYPYRWITLGRLRVACGSITDSEFTAVLNVARSTRLWDVCSHSKTFRIRPPDLCAEGVFEFCRECDCLWWSVVGAPADLLSSHRPRLLWFLNALMDDMPIVLNIVGVTADMLASNRRVNIPCLHEFTCDVPIARLRAAEVISSRSPPASPRPFA